jgi:hypothetical protein
MHEPRHWHLISYVRPSRRKSSRDKTQQAALVSLHKREAALALPHCRGCGAFMPTTTRSDRCRSCQRRAWDGDTRHWWSGLKGREKRQPRP